MTGLDTFPKTEIATEPLRAHRYVVLFRPDGEAPLSWETLVVDVGGDSGGFQEMAEADFLSVAFKADEITHDPDHVAFGAPIWVEPQLTEA